MVPGKVGCANRHPPALHHRTRAGADRQWIEKHPAYRRLEEVALSLGCSRVQAFLRVTLPLARTSILAGSVMAGDDACCAQAQHGSAPDLAGKNVVTTAGTTSERLIRKMNEDKAMKMNVISAKDHGGQHNEILKNFTDAILDGAESSIFALAEDRVRAGLIEKSAL